MEFVYLAAPESYQAMMRQWRADLASLGYSVTSTWLDRDIPTDIDVATSLEYPDWALQDLADIVRADAVISCTLESTGRGGRHAEFGMGVAFGRRMVRIGPAEHLFHRLPLVDCFPDWVTFVLAVQAGEWGHR